MKTILRKTISALVLGTVAVSFSACAGSQLPEQQYKELSISIEKYKEEFKFGGNAHLKPYKESYYVYSIYSDTSHIATLKEVANICKAKGFKYFEIIEAEKETGIKEKIDNTTPITNIKDYIAFRGFNGGEIENGHSLNGSVRQMSINFSNEIVNDHYFWNCENVIKEEVVLTNPFSMKEKESEAVKWNEWTKRTFDKTNIKYTIINRD